MSKFVIAEIVEETDSGVVAIFAIVVALVLLISPIVGALSIIDYGLVFAEGILTSWIIWMIWGIGLAIAIIFKQKGKAIKSVIIRTGIAELVVSVIVGCISYSNAGIWSATIEQSLIVIPFCLFVGIIEEALIAGVILSLLNWLAADVGWKTIIFLYNKKRSDSRNRRKHNLVKIDVSETYNQYDVYWKCKTCGQLIWKCSAACGSCGTAKCGGEQWFRKEK